MLLAFGELDFASVDADSPEGVHGFFAWSDEGLNCKKPRHLTGGALMLEVDKGKSEFGCNSSLTPIL